MKNKSDRKTVIQDDFTKKILEIFYNLVAKGAVYKKKEYYTALDITPSTWGYIEDHMRNYPNNADKRNKAELALIKTFKVNPEYLSGRSKDIFSGEPEKVAPPLKDDVSKVYYRNKNEKLDLLKEKEELQAYIKEQDELIQELRETLTRYVTDNKSDKKK